MNKISSTVFVLIAILVVALFFGIQSFGLPNIKARVVPIVASTFVFVLAAIELIRELRVGFEKKDKPARAPQPVSPAVSGERRRLFALFCWMFGLFVAIYILGYPISIFLFVFVFLKLHGRGWIASFSSAVLTAGVIYFLFMIVLKIPLFQGIIFEGFSIEHWIESGRKAL